MLKKILIFFPSSDLEIILCYSLILVHLFVRLSQFQNYHTNMKRLDITLTKFIKLHDCIPVNVRFAVYTQNFLSLNGISWYKTNGYYI